jgi:hypothetical protein
LAEREDEIHAREEEINSILRHHAEEIAHLEILNTERLQKGQEDFMVKLLQQKKEYEKSRESLLKINGDEKAKKIVRM